MPSTLPAGLGLSSANLTFDDEFNSFTSSPDGSTGYRTTYPYGGTAARSLPANGELEYYSDPSVGENPFSDSNGVLDIQASVAAPGSNPQNLPYDSGLATTQGMFQQEYGYFEVSAKLPPGPGMWSGFWLLPYDNLGGAELDIFEILGSYTNRLYTTTHSVNANGVHTANSIPNDVGVDLTAAFHTYGVDWEPTQITWYLDGRAVSTQTTPPGFNTPMYMLLNLAIGGFGGTPNDPSAFPGNMQVDYLHAYATANTIRVAGGAAHQSASLYGVVSGPAGRVDAMTVDLLDAAGDLVSSAVTDINGYFIFTQLAAGTYRVLYEAPPGLAPQAGGVADPFGAMSGPLTLTDGQSMWAGQETLAAATLGSLGGSVVRQVGGNPATPLSGETVKLLQAGSVVATTVSRADGSFVFGNLAAGAYTVQYTVRTNEMLVAGGPASTKTGLSASVTLAAGQAASLAAQTVSPLPGAVSGTVRYSATGMQGVAGVLLQGATVSLLDQTGTAVASAVTDANGNYMFTNVLAGQYHVLYGAAAGYAFLSGSAANPVSGISDSTVFVTSGNRTVAPTETLTSAAAVATLTGTVRFYDGANPATPLAGAVVTVATATGQAVRAVATDATGAYSFVNLGPGGYEVLFSAPSGDAFQIGGPASFVTGTTGVVSLSSGQAYQMAPETLVADIPAAVAGSVLEAPAYTTSLGTGLALAGETVSLVGAGGLVVATTATDATGGFRFAGLVPGIYTVRYAIAPATSLQAGGPANPVTGATAAISVQAGQGVTLAAETLVPLPATITGSVSYNGAPVSYAAVVATDASGAVVASTATNYTGTYSFTGLVAGTYQIRYVAPKYMALLAGPADPGSGLTAAITVAAGSKVTLAAETLTPAPASVGGVVVLAAGLGQDGVGVAAVRADGSTAASTTTGANGSWQISGLAAGSYMLQFTVPAGEVLQSGASATTGLTGAFSLSSGQALTAAHVTLAPVSPAALGGSVLSSFNGQAAALAGIQVTLLAAGGALTTTTSGTGAFQFRGLAAGSYQLRYAAPAGDSLQAGGPADPASGVTAALTLGAGQTVTLAPETLVVPPATVAGSVLYAAGAGPASPEAGVVVSLLRAGTVVASVHTDPGGAFRFAGLAAGSYQLGYAAPAGQLPQAGGPADPATARTAAFSLTPGQTATAATETLVGTLGVIGGVVLLQANGAPAPQAGVAVSLFAAGGTAALATAATDATGAFQFAGLAAATYTVGYALPAGQVRQSGGPADVTTGLTAAIPLAAGQSDTLAAETFVAASARLSGSVQLAGASLAGESVSLLAASGASSGAPSGAGAPASGTVLATATTDASGAFAFSGLVAGSYSVAYAVPAGDALQAGGPADPGTGVTQPYVLAAAQAVTVPTQGLVALAPGIGGTVVHVGSGDPGTGLGGVTVALLNASWTVLRTTLTSGTGAFSFRSLAAGSYRLRYTLPAGEALSGAGADPASGTTGPIALASGQALTLATQTVASTSTSFTMTGSGGAALRGDGSYTVTGNASTSSLRLGNGNQSVTLTGFSDTVVAGNGNQAVMLAGTTNSVTVGDGTQTISAGSGFSTVTLGATPAGTTSTVTLGGTGNKVVAGPGNVSVGGSAGSTTVTLGAGNQTVTLGGSSNTVTVGAGASTIVAGQNGNTVHAAGGDAIHPASGDTISVSGQGNLLDAGAGMNFYNATGGSRLDVFMLNGSGQGLTTITGFNASDTLDLARTVAGLGVLGDLSNLGHFVTSGTGSGGTTLFVDPTGGAGTPYAFATLGNVATSVAQLVAGHNISLT